MSKNKMTRRAFGALIPSVVLLPELGSAQASSTNVRDGDAWQLNDKSMKLGYVIGFVDAASWAYGNVEGQLQVLKSLSPKDRQLLAGGKDVWDFENIKYKQLIEGMDSFYNDYRNKAVQWDRALSYVRDTIHGDSQEFLEQELEFERKKALLDSEQK
jgi:hypothetical protein